MSEKQPKWLTLTEARDRLRTHPLRLAEVPVEHAISFPLPTRRWGGPGYAFFASPVRRQPGAAPVHSPPQSWWVLDARGGRVLVYARMKALAFADGAGDWEPATLSPVTVPMAELRQAMVDLEQTLSGLAPAFFADEPGDAVARQKVQAGLGRLIPEVLLPQYRALAPDFFAWLEQ
jgi:hypothetical protein